ncbi:MAG: hypothetical protein ACR2F8_13090 [Caulobacteraceae bacterium]
MIGAVAFAVVLNAAPAPELPDIGARIAAAGAAEQGLQGPLDGSWVLGDTAGRLLYRLQIVDPAGGHGPLTGAWSDARGGVGTGFIARIRRTARTLRLEFTPSGRPPVTLRLRSGSPGVWSGWTIDDGARRAVILRRG